MHLFENRILRLYKKITIPVQDLLESAVSNSRNKPANREDFHHWIDLAVRWGDTDALGHVNNANYFSYMEVGRLAYMAHLDHFRLLQDKKTGPILAHIECSFRREIKFPSSLQIGTRVTELRTRSYVMQHGIFLETQESAMADGSSVIVWIDYTLKKALPLPDPIKADIKLFDRL
jgi:acyl-CoA thioester hydrolase